MSISTNLVNVVERLSYISEKELDFLAKKSLLPVLKDAKLDMCNHCGGKQRRLSFKHHFSARRRYLSWYIHVYGPLKVNSIGGALYFVTFIDDHSRKLWV